MVGTRSRAAQAAANGWSAQSTGTRGTTRGQTRGSRGRGAVSVATVASGRGRGATSLATVVSGAGTSDDLPATAQPNQVILYQDEKDDLGAVQTQDFSGHGPRAMYRINLKVPKYEPEKGDLWERYTQQMKFHMEAIFD